jgi:hypothetical protein
MKGAIPPFPQYAFMALYLVKAQGLLYLYLYVYLKTELSAFLINNLRKKHPSAQDLPLQKPFCTSLFCHGIYTIQFSKVRCKFYIQNCED